LININITFRVNRREGKVTKRRREVKSYFEGIFIVDIFKFWERYFPSTPLLSSKVSDSVI